ncbi:MAG: transcriptional regulator [Desulfobulbus propionicus]|nr:MAG: transcriptional regulator [Desulfobulbus propionicus]
MQKDADLQKSFLFQGLQEDQLASLANIAVSRSYARGKTVFMEGDPCIGFYMITAGQVKIYKTSSTGKEQILHVFGPGEPFGEVPVFYGRPFPATATVLVDSEVLFFPRKEFVELITANSSLALSMLAVLSLRLRQFVTKVENLSLKEVPARLAAHLLYLAEEQGRKDRVDLDISKGHLASLLGTSPETLSRILTRMKEDGLIRVEGKVIYLLDKEALGFG